MTRWTLTPEEFFNPPEIPRLVHIDAYTLGTAAHASLDERERTVFHMVPRRGFSQFFPQFVKDDRIIFGGLRRILSWLLRPITQEEIDETEAFCQGFHAGGTPFRWNREMWQQVLDERNGVIPIRIEAFREGICSLPGEPVIQVESAQGFGMAALWFESKLLHVWATSERMTVARWWLHYLQERCRSIHPSWSEEQVKFVCSIMCHDFGDRAGICRQESEILGEAHILVFSGTDTTAGAWRYWKESSEHAACSIHALAHHTVTGYPTEMECHEALYALGQQVGITAHVSDTYDFYATVERLAERLATGDWKDDKNVIVSRPDSGDAVDTTLHVMRMAKKYGLTQESDGLLCATRLRCIQGDSMNWNSMIQIMNVALAEGFSPFGFLAFGVGGWLRNSIKRDHAGTSYKLASANGRPTCKRSETEAKSSIPGKVMVLDNNNNNPIPTVYPYVDTACHGRSDLLQVWWDGINSMNHLEAIRGPALETGVLIRERIQAYFLHRSIPNQVLSSEVLEMRRKILDEQGAAVS